MKNTTIEWTHHLFNPWLGCSKVSPACSNCYAQGIAERFGHAKWSANEPRKYIADDRWRDPLRWNREAQQDGVRRRVFCASMADVFEGRSDLDFQRRRLWSIIQDAPHLDWLLLTKRAENIEKMVPWQKDWPNNVWLGTTVETQEYAEKRLPHLLKHPAKFRFISAEPLLGPLDLRTWFNRRGSHPLDWVIAGGESGPKARPTHPDWFHGLRDQCNAAGAAFFFKQWGHWVPADDTTPDLRPSQRTLTIEGGPHPMIVRRVRDKSFRVLDGQTWDEIPCK